MPNDTTLSGVPRAEGPAPETPQEDIRNALSMLWHPVSTQVDRIAFTYADYEAIMSRLWSAVYKLERR